MSHSPLAITVCGLRFERPILNASGAFYAPSFARMFSLTDTLGGLVTKTVTAEALVGNRPPRTVELPGIGMLNSIGLQNPGLSTCLDSEIPNLAQHKLPLTMSISAHCVEDFAAMAERIVVHPHYAYIAMLELNLSCPNVSAGGIHFGTDAGAVREVLAAVKAVWPKPLWAKLTPNVTDITAIGQAAVEGGADGLTAINTVMGLAIDIKRKRPVLPRASAGYSGPGIRPIALNAVWQLHRALPETPIMGVGGIESADDVLAFLLAGASLVQVGTSCFRQPFVFQQMTQQLTTYCEVENQPLSSWIGGAHT